MNTLTETVTDIHFTVVGGVIQGHYCEQCGKPATQYYSDMINTSEDGAPPSRLSCGRHVPWAKELYDRGWYAAAEAAFAFVEEQDASED